MSTTALAPNGAGPAITPSTLEGVVVHGDLSKLSPAQRLEWYNQRCAAAGLDPRTQPFQYLSLQGKLTLYATKAATDQLIAQHKLRVEVIDRRAHADLGVYEVQVRVTRGDGSTVDDLAAVPIAGLKGDALCNAFMKCVTKAKRRTVLSACGLGMLDETEVETIPNAVRVDVEPDPAPPDPPGEAPIAPESVADAKADLLDAATQVGLTLSDAVKLCQDSFGHRSLARLTPSQFLNLRDHLIPAEAARRRRAAPQPEAQQTIEAEVIPPAPAPPAEDDDDIPF